MQILEHKILSETSSSLKFSQWSNIVLCIYAKQPAYGLQYGRAIHLKRDHLLLEKHSHFRGVQSVIEHIFNTLISYIYKLRQKKKKANIFALSSNKTLIMPKHRGILTSLKYMFGGLIGIDIKINSHFLLCPPTRRAPVSRCSLAKITRQDRNFCILLVQRNGYI